MCRISIIAAATLLAATGALAQSPTTKKFLTDAIQGNYAEVQMGELAQQNSQNQEVRSYGKMLVTDHKSANQNAIDVAQSLHVPSPNGPSAKQKADHDKMAKLSGSKFDRAFAKHMVADHKKDIAAYKKEAKSNDAAGQYAQEALPTLEKHLEHAQQLQKETTARR